MARTGRERVGVLIVRAWEESPGSQVRIRVTYRTDVLAGAETVAAAITPDEVCAHVRTWLRGVQRSDGTPA
jgi:hypothetical protein